MITNSNKGLRAIVFTNSSYCAYGYYFIYDSTVNNNNETE